MNCPGCGEPMLLTSRQGVEIDYCAACLGIWLDRGELEKIMESTIAENSISNYPPSGNGDLQKKKRFLSEFFYLE